MGSFLIGGESTFHSNKHRRIFDSKLKKMAPRLTWKTHQIKGKKKNTGNVHYQQIGNTNISQEWISIALLHEARDREEARTETL